MFQLKKHLKLDYDLLILILSIFLEMLKNIKMSAQNQTFCIKFGTLGTKIK